MFRKKRPKGVVGLRIVAVRGYVPYPKLVTYSLGDSALQEVHSEKSYDPKYILLSGGTAFIDLDIGTKVRRDSRVWSNIKANKWGSFPDTELQEAFGGYHLGCHRVQREVGE